MWFTPSELETLEYDNSRGKMSSKYGELLARSMNFEAAVKDSKWKCLCGTNHYSIDRPTNCLTCGRVWKIVEF